MSIEETKKYLETQREVSILIRRFGNAQKKKMMKNAHKGTSWNNCSLVSLGDGLIKEFNEWFDFVILEDESSFTPSRNITLKKELVDIANMAMMLWDRL